jgi:cytoskeletal protein CcmA (bactofilin family)
MKLMRKSASVPLDTLIGAKTIFEGCIYSERSVCIEGSVRGRIEAKGEVVVGRQGKVEADIQADSVVVGGHIIGNILVHRSLEITATGRVTGDIVAATIAVAEGGTLDGFCKMLTTAESPYPKLEQRLSIEENRQSDVKSQSAHVENLPRI